MLGAGMAAAISLYLYAGAAATLTGHARENIAATVAASGERMSEGLALLKGDVTFLAGTPPVLGLAAGSKSGQAEAAASFWRDRLAETFVALMAARQQYVRLRLVGIADGGREVVRVDRASHGGIMRVADERLQQTGDQHFFQQAMMTGRGRTHLSRIELNRAGGKIEEPHLPVIRITTLVFDPLGEVFGLVVADVDARWLLRRVATGSAGAHLWYVTNADGDFLLSPDATRDFGFDLGRRHRIQDEFPQLAGVLGSDARHFEGIVTSAGASYLASARQVPLDAEQPGRFVVVAGLRPVASLFGEINRLRRDTALIALALVACGSVIAVMMARAVAGPLRQLTAAATQMARGDRGIDLGALARRRDETGELAGAFAAMARQISERQERLEAQARELSRSNQELAQFAYVASHDLQEPLRMVGSYLELLEHRHGAGLGGEAREFIDFAIDGAARMKQLINDLLDYSRAGYRELKRARVDLNQVVANVVRVLGEQIDRTGATVEVATLPTVEADAVQIERVFLNLIENALKYRGPQPPQVDVGAERLAGGWRIAVTDNGIGIEPRFRDKVFEIFRRLHDREKYSGTGIGLAVVKLVVERHGGSVGVDARPGGGTVLSFTLPDKADQPCPSKPSPSTSS
ncbi:MAG: hypothetical protein BroJett030_32490 [Alphaproteobacteria bacterium]|nr:MAG: hypothetical protein BroJett030_32490 [Alphaproteobacteria bacterium]